MNEVATPVRPMGLFARAVGVITSPRATFENVVAVPQPIGILLIVVIVMSLGAMLPPMLSEDALRSTVDMQVEMEQKFSGRQIDAAEYDRRLERARTFLFLTPINFLITMPLFSLFFAAVYWVIFNAILGGTASFKQVLAIVTHSQIITALGVLVAAPVQVAQGQISMAGPFTLRAILPGLPEGSIWAIVLGFTSVFTIWGLIVTAIGLAVLYRRKTRNIAIALIVTYFLIASAVVSLFSSFLRR